MSCGISIIVCCYNSSRRIRNTIQHIAKQKASREIEWELIIVDNNCTDDTVEAVLNEWHTQAINKPIKIVTEKKPGLKEARNCGVKHAKFDWVLFCDDDNWLNDNYLEIVYETFLNNNEISIIGGRGEAITEIEEPYWFNEFKSYYAIGKQAEQSGFLFAERKFVYGAGMAVRKELINHISNLNYESPLTDRKGSDLSSGGDVEICYLAYKLGYNIYYHDELVFKHFISEERLNWQYIIRLFEGFAKADSYLSILYLNLDNVSPNKILKHRFKEILSFLRIYKKDLLNYLFFRRKKNVNHMLLGYYLLILKSYLININSYKTYIKSISSF